MFRAAQLPRSTDGRGTRSLATIDCFVAASQGTGSWALVTNRPIEARPTFRLRALPMCRVIRGPLASRS
jgi:hypothetical protein